MRDAGTMEWKRPVSHTPVSWRGVDGVEGAVFSGGLAQVTGRGSSTSPRVQVVKGAQQVLLTVLQHTPRLVVQDL